MTMMSTRDQRPRLAPPSRRPPGPPAPGDGGGITPRELLRIVRKCWLMIALSLTICVMVAVIVTFLWRRYAPSYTARALMKVIPPPTAFGRDIPYSKDILERYKRDMAALAKRDAVLAEAIKNPQITSTTWFDRHRGDAIRELQRKLRVTAVPETNLIQLSMRGTNKEELPGIVNSAAAALEAFAGKGARKSYDDKIKALQEKGSELTLKIKDLSDKTTRTLAGSPLAAMQGRQSEANIKHGILLRELNEAQKELTQARALLEAWRGEEDHSQNPLVAQALDLDMMLRQLTVQLANYKANLENALRKFDRKHRTVQDLKQLIKAMEGQIEDRTDEVVAKQISSLTQIRETAVEIVTARFVELQDERGRIKSAASDLEEKIASVESGRREIEQANEQLQLIEHELLKYTLLRTPGEVGKSVGQVLVESRAGIPREISWPTWGIMVTLGVLSGLILGLGLAFLLEFVDTSIKSPTDVSRRIDLPLLGMVPHADDMDEEISDFRLATLEAPHSLVAEAFRQIRTNLLFSGPAEQRRSLLITSPAPEDGRTTVVLNLAASMAQAGRRVLVVDANFRQPSIGRIFPDSAEAGLSSALVGQANWRDVASPSGMPNCDVIVAGPLPPNPAELLGSDAMRRMINEMAAEYDQVLFDGSPVMVVSDACILSTQVDGVVLVIRAGRNSTGIVQKAAGQLQRIGAHVLGAVLQGVRTTAGGYLRKNYETFYEYHQQALP